MEIISGRIFKQFLVTFNGGSPMRSLVFVPTECEVVNMANTGQVFSLWDAANPDMCDLSSSPVDFKIVQKPNDDRAFYGFTYTGKPSRTISFNFKKNNLRFWLRLS